MLKSSANLVFLILMSAAIPTQLHAQCASVTYTYDAAGRLTGAAYSSGAGASYTYEWAGNGAPYVNCIVSQSPASR